MLFRLFAGSLAACLSVLVMLPCPAQGKTVPVSDFIRHPAFRSVTISPDGKYLSVVSAVKNTNKYQLAILPTRSVVKHKPRVTSHFSLTDHEIFAGVTWVNDTRLVAATATRYGGFDRPMLTGKLFAINADGGQQKELMGPNTGYYFWGVLDRLSNTSRAILVAGTQGRTHRMTAYRLDLYPGNGTVRLGRRNNTRHIATSPVPYGGLWSDHNGDVRIATGASAKTGLPKIYYRAPGSMDWQNKSDLIGARQAYAAVSNGGPIMFGPENKKVYVRAPANNAAETTGLYFYNPETGKKKLLYANPKVDIRGVIESFDRKSLVGVKIEPGKPQIIALDTKAPRIQLLVALRQALPGVQVNITSWTKDGSEAIVRTWSDTKPPTYYLYTAKPKPKLSILFRETPWIKPAALSPMKPIQFKSRDGLTIHGYLVLPRGKQAKDLPMVVYVHGGPHGIRTNWGYNPVDFDSVAEQILANHGYAVLSLNYRGSGGYGLKFLTAGFRHWGDTMQNDLADGVKWAVKQGYANPARVCIFGASYGGYAAIMSPERFPDLYKCAIGYDGCYDLQVNKTRASDTARSAPGRLYMETVLGSNAKQLKAFSPADNADKLKIPVFLLHGGRDVRCPVEGYDKMKAAIEKHGTPLKTLFEPNEGHGFYKIAHREKAWKEMLAFFGKYIGSGASQNVAPR